MALELIRIFGRRSDLLPGNAAWGGEVVVAISSDEPQWHVLRKHRPDDSGVFGGDGDAGSVVPAALSHAQGPAGETIGASQRRLQHRARTHDQ